MFPRELLERLRDFSGVRRQGARPLQDRGRHPLNVIWRRAPSRSVEDVECATLTWVDWFNTRRLLESTGYMPPVEFEAAYYQHQAAEAALPLTAL